MPAAQFPTRTSYVLLSRTVTVDIFDNHLKVRPIDCIRTKSDDKFCEAGIVSALLFALFRNRISKETDCMGETFRNWTTCGHASQKVNFDIPLVRCGSFTKYVNFVDAYN